MERGGSNATSATRLMRAVFLSRYGWGGVIAALAVTGGLIYWFHEEIASAYTSAQDGVVATLGLGVVPVALWLVAFLLALAKRRSWFRRVNLWVGSLVLVAFLLGFMGLFQPDDGALATFTQDGDVSLGGNVGEAVAGQNAWQAVLRVLAVFVVGAGVAAPGMSVDLAAGLWRLSVYAYVFSMVAVRGIFSALRRMDRFAPERAGAGDSAESEAPSAVSGTDLRAKVEQATRTKVPGAAAKYGPPPAPKALPAPALAEEETLLESDIDEWEEPAPALGPDLSDEVQSEAPQPAAGKFNRFWSGSSEDRQKASSPPDGRVTVRADADKDGSAAGPILDAMESSWQRPKIDLLVDSPVSGISDAEMAETAETIKRTLAEYNIEVDIGQIRPGPTVTMYGLIPGWIRRHKQVKVTDEHGQPKLNESGKPSVARVETKTRVKVDSIISREKDLSLALKTPSIRIETPVMGQSLVGLEVPNPSPTLVTLRGVMESEEFKKLRRSAKLPVALGKASGGENVVVDLANMPHLLIAGATGSGKSVCINTLVSCLIMEKTPAEMRLLLVDPKRVELTPYNGIPHLLTPVVVETDQVVALLKGLIREMLSRYRLLEEIGVRNIDAYNSRMPEKMPYLVVAVDELADLMMTASFDVEQSLCRLAQLGRATGIHLIIATQRPSVDVVTGLIKANFPSRLSFAVTSHIDSRTILDSVGAEKLLGRGDMLYLSVDASRPERVQGVYASDQEIESLVHFWQTTPWGPLSKVSLHAVGTDHDDEVAKDGNEGGARDELLEKAMDLAYRYKKLSTSLLQRRMRIGYPRAARLMDQLEEAGIVGPSDGSKSRDVIISQT